VSPAGPSVAAPLPPSGPAPAAGAPAPGGPAAPLAGAPPSAPPTAAFNWLTYNEALAQGKKSRQFIILYFTNETASVRKFEGDVFENPQVKQTLQKFALARIVSIDSKDLVQKYGILVFPTFVFLGPDGYTRSRIDGVPSAQTLLKELGRYAK